MSNAPDMGADFKGEEAGDDTLAGAVEGVFLHGGKRGAAVGEAEGTLEVECEEVLVDAVVISVEFLHLPHHLIYEIKR